MTLALLLAVASLSQAWIGDLPSVFKSGAAAPKLETIAPRSVLVEGNFARFERVWTRLGRGESIRIATIGGSITQGAGASKPANRWCNRFAEGWRRAFPACKIELVNAGIGATGSDIGAFRVNRDVIAKKPDVVVVEFSVNDPATQERAASYEGLLRQLLKAPGEIAVIAVATVSEKGVNAQELHAKVAAHYGVPFVSYRDALYYPYVKEGVFPWRDISPDSVHPNDDGHAYLAALVNCELARRYGEWKAAGEPQHAIPAFPEPIYGTRYDQGEFCLLKDAKIRVNEGFFTLRDNCWGDGLACTNAGGRIVFEVEGSTVALLYRCGRDPYNWGKIAVKIDGRSVVDNLDCFRDQWWWYTPSLFLCRETPGRHVVEIRTLEEKNAKSKGYGCHLTGLLLAGKRQ